MKTTIFLFHPDLKGDRKIFCVRMNISLILFP